MPVATTRDELRRLIEVLTDAELDATKVASDALVTERENALDAFHLRLLASGLLAQLPSQRRADEHDAFEPVPVGGELVSSIITHHPGTSLNARLLYRQ
jgi:hypothetical protein